MCSRSAQAETSTVLTFNVCNAARSEKNYTSHAPLHIRKEALHLLSVRLRRVAVTLPGSGGSAVLCF